MDQTIIVIIIIILSSIILFIINKTTNEHFDTFEMNTAPFDVNNFNEPSIIIPHDDINNNFPIESHELKIEAPTIPIIVAKEDEPFKANQFIRDKGITNAMNKLSSNNNTSYSKVADAYVNFVQPVDSTTMIQHKQYNEFTQDQLNDMYIHDIHDAMIGKVDNNISKEEIERITGKPNDVPTISGLYKPVYQSIDDTNLLSTVESKYKPYEPLLLGSVI